MNAAASQTESYLLSARSLVLGIEISNPTLGGGVALGERAHGGEVRLLGTQPVRTGGREDDDLFPALDRLVRSAGTSAKEVGAVAVSVGPGGFTGVRVAVSAAKSICEATGAACLAVPTAAVAWRGVEPAIRAASAVWVALAWKRDDCWCHRFEPGDGQGRALGILTLEELSARAEGCLVVDDELRAMLVERGLSVGRVRVERPRLDAGALIEAARFVPAIDPLALAPLYPREPEAVSKWRRLHPRG